MEQSGDVRDAMLRFCDRLSAGDVANFDELVSQDATLIIGTAPGRMDRRTRQNEVRLRGGGRTARAR
jgi:hypothetical protein